MLYFLEEEEDSPLEQFLEDLMEILDPNGPIATPVATIGVLGKLYFVIYMDPFHLILIWFLKIDWMENS